MPWNTAPDIERQIADVLSLAGGRDVLTPAWQGIGATKLTEAYNLIRSVLIGRGYSAAQLDTWAARLDFEREIALLFALEEQAADRPESYPQIAAKQRWLDWLLAPTLVLLDATGAEIVPGGDASALVGFGALDTRRDPIVFNEPGRRNPWQY